MSKMYKFFYILILFLLLTACNTNKKQGVEIRVDNLIASCHAKNETESSNQKDVFIYVCKLIQNIDLRNKHLYRLKTIPNDIVRDSFCTKEML